jgi:hypothetical protein
MKAVTQSAAQGPNFLVFGCLAVMAFLYAAAMLNVVRWMPGSRQRAG